MSPRVSVCEEVLKAIRAMIRAIDMQSKMLHLRYGLTGPQLTALKEIQFQGVTTTSQLANYISVSQSTAAIIIDRLVEDELVSRTRDLDDKRKWFVSLTTQGKKALQNAPPLLQSGFIDQFNGLPSWEQTHILATLQRLVAMLNVTS